MILHSRCLTVRTLVPICTYLYVSVRQRSKSINPSTRSVQVKDLILQIVHSIVDIFCGGVMWIRSL